MAAARKSENRTQVSKRRTKNNVIDPGKLDLGRDMELLRDQAASMNPHYQISCILSDLDS
jgi:hypothetical protein